VTGLLLLLLLLLEEPPAQRVIALHFAIAEAAGWGAADSLCME